MDRITDRPFIPKTMRRCPRCGEMAQENQEHYCTVSYEAMRPLYDARREAGLAAEEAVTYLYILAMLKALGLSPDEANGYLLRVVERKMFSDITGGGMT